MAETDVADNAVGYLSIVEHKTDGLFGGYLIVTPMGRPLEFHCTTPVVANRAQEILYGASLRPYLCGELISQQLLRQASRAAAVVLVDSPEMIVAESFTELPLASIGAASESDRDRIGELQVAHQHHEFGGRHGELDYGLCEIATSAPIIGAPQFGDVADVARIAGLDGRCYHVAFGPRTARNETDRLLSMLRASSEAIDLLEPFQRIRMAIDEARRMSAA